MVQGILRNLEERWPGVTTYQIMMIFEHAIHGIARLLGNPTLSNGW